MPRYSKTFIEHFTNPRNVGVIEAADGVGVEVNSACGDTMTLHLKIDDDTIVDAKFQTLGCSASIATSSVTTELVKGITVAEARGITRQHLAQALDGLPPAKLHSSVLAIDTLNAALDNVEVRAAQAKA